jgi:lysophospholipase L1-like esterase
MVRWKRFRSERCNTGLSGIRSVEVVVVSRLTTVVVGLVFLVGVLLALPVLPGRAHAYHLASQDMRVKRIAVVGDSYTTGTDEGGWGPRSWTSRAWQGLSSRGLRVAADVAAEGKAGYGVPGDHGSFYKDLTARAARPDDLLVLFFGSRNDQAADPGALTDRVRETFDLARSLAPTAGFLVIGPPWPTADVPEPVLRVRNILGAAARAAGADFVDPIGGRWFVGRPDLIGPDGVHPNDAGHKYMADKIAPLIFGQLSRG